MMQRIDTKGFHFVLMCMGTFIAPDITPAHPAGKRAAGSIKPANKFYLKHFPSAVEMLQGPGVLHRQMDIRDCQLVGQLIDLLHALFHLREFLLEQLQEPEREQKEAQNGNNNHKCKYQKKIP